jgi:hypothetical protein
MKLLIRRWFNFVEHHVDHGDPHAAPLRKVAVAAVVENPTPAGTSKICAR